MSARTGPDGLTDRQRKFVAAYKGNATEAARAAGYKCSDKKNTEITVHRLITHPAVVAALKGRSDKEVAPLVMSRMERQAFWSSVANNPAAKMQDRLRASELLAKSEGDFLENVTNITNNTLSLPVGLSIDEMRALARMDLKSLPEGVVEGEIVEEHDGSTEQTDVE